MSKAIESRFLTITKELCDIYELSSIKEFSIEVDKKSIYYLMHNRCVIFSFKTDNLYFYIGKYRLSGIDPFIQFLEQSIVNEVVPYFKKAHKRKEITWEKINIKSNDERFSITTDIFKKIFNDAAENQGNSEISENISIEVDKSSNIIIKFDVDCHRYGVHKYNKVIINDRNDISVKLCEYLESGGIESEVKEKLEKILNDTN